jgi:hypothetical protein
MPPRVAFDGIWRGWFTIAWLEDGSRCGRGWTILGALLARIGLHLCICRRIEVEDMTRLAAIPMGFIVSEAWVALVYTQNVTFVISIFLVAIHVIHVRTKRK